MKSKKLLMLLSTLVLCMFAISNNADAYQPYGGGYYRPPPRADFQARHRIHGYVGAQLSGMIVVNQMTDFDRGGYLGHGGGGGLFAGLRLGPFISLEANWSMTYNDEVWDNYYNTYILINSLYLSVITADLKIHIPVPGPVEPFFQVGIGWAYLGAYYDDYYNSYYSRAFATGVAFDAGGGLDLWLSPWVSVGGRLLYKGIAFGDVVLTSSGIHSNNIVNSVCVDFFATFHF